MRSRRDFLADFLRRAGCFAVAATLPAAPRVLAALERTADAGGGADAAGRAPRYRFPQGLASGDPTPTSVVLWTRVEAVDGARGPVDVTVQVAETAAFARVVAERTVRATAASDHTVRVVVTGLAPDRRYHYRFVAGARAEGRGDATGVDPARGDATPLVGRTRTAPADDAERPVRLAFVSCQAYEAGFYGAWRTMLNEDLARPEAEQLDFVLHLGDFIYEALGYGGARRIAPFPSGGGRVSTGSGKAWAETHAVTVDDYRHLYRTYLADPDLQAARARWPFVVTWDDHEFSDDAWQGRSSYTLAGEPAQARKLAANQAWFEFVPALLTGAPAVGGAPAEARDFAPATARDAPFAGRDAAGFWQEPNNVAAVGSMTIYRSFRWGRHVELVVGDARSYRSEHPVPPELATALGGTARYLVPQHVARTLDAGRLAADGAPPATLPVAGGAVPNPRRDLPPGTMLGARQKAWWRATMAGTTATWKLWANSVPLMPMRIDVGALLPGADDAVFTIDTWEGYQHERGELLGFLAGRGVTNVVSLTGDNHNHFAGVLVPDFDLPPGDARRRAVGAELATCGVSSTSVWKAFRGSVQPGTPRYALVAWDPARHGRPGPERPALNVTWLWGARAALTLAATGDVRAAQGARDPAHNAHLRYCDASANGYALATAHGDRLEAELVTVEEPLVDRGAAGARVLRRARFVLPAWRAGEEARLALTGVDGTPPFPFDVLASA